MSAVAEPPAPRPSSRLRQWIRRGAVAVGGVLGLALAASALWIAQPLPEGMLDYRPVSSVRILDRGGHLLRELRSRQDGRSTPIPGEEIPAHLRAAFIAAEDERFFSHPGVDPLAIARAAWSNLRAGRIVAGGSTMTQQLARVLVPRRRTLAGKVQEALWAMRLELHLTKEEILTQYLNRIPFGNGTFGIEAASQLYFARRTQFLSLGQAAVLAAIPRGPTAYDPYRRPARLEARRRWVLDRLVRTGAVSPEDASREKEAPLDLHAFSSTFRAPHLVEYVARNLDAWGLGEATSIETTIDPELQASVEQAVAQEIRRLGEKNVGSAAAIAVDNRTGEVLAYVGSADFFDVEHEGQNDGVQMRRQPGSALKPFAYVEAFSSGMTPATVLADTEAQFAGRSGVYSPENYDRRTHGPIRAREALANSYNVPAVRVAEQLGPERLLRALRQAGFDSLDKGSEHYGLGLVLGDGEVSLWHAARAYAGLSRGGVLRPLRVVRRALRPDGTELPVSDELAPRRFAAEVPVALVTDVLADNDARGRAFGLDSVLRLPFPVAAKTGHLQGLRGQLDRGVHPRAHGGGVGRELRRQPDAGRVRHQRRRADLPRGHPSRDARDGPCAAGAFEAARARAHLSTLRRTRHRALSRRNGRGVRAGGGAFAQLRDARADRAGPRSRSCPSLRRARRSPRRGHRLRAGLLRLGTSRGARAGAVARSAVPWARTGGGTHGGRCAPVRAPRVRCRIPAVPGSAARGSDPPGPDPCRSG